MTLPFSLFLCLALLFFLGVGCTNVSRFTPSGTFGARLRGDDAEADGLAFGNREALGVTSASVGYGEGVFLLLFLGRLALGILEGWIKLAISRLM